jgi:hypothetical protein
MEDREAAAAIRERHHHAELAAALKPPS